MCGVADTTRRVANISLCAADISLPKTQFFPFFENFSKCFGLFQGEKYTFFQKFSKIGLVAEKKMITFRGVSDPKVIKITFFKKINPSPT